MTTQDLAICGLGLFSDEVFTSSDLNRRCSVVLNHARRNPVTISRNNEQFALLRREHAASLVKALTHLSSIVGLIMAVEAIKNGETPAPDHAWVKAFDEEDRTRMIREILPLASSAIYTNDWDSVEARIHEWNESAEVILAGVLNEAIQEESEEQPLTDPRDIATREPDCATTGK